MKINGVKLLNLKVIKNPKGDILKFINKRTKFFKGFGEIYFTEIKNKKTKGWNLHKKNFCIISVPFGKVIFHLIDGRKRSKTFNKEQKYSINKKNYKILLIPPGVWFSFRSLNKISIVSNMLNNIHAKNETQKTNMLKNIKIK
jgi:dTDP-4-dehydrorhamnose 3,5-epimerase